MNNWQPIETAPKDGTFVLLWSPSTHTYPLTGAFEIQDREWLEVGAYDPAAPTHWMPVPEPPK